MGPCNTLRKFSRQFRDWGITIPHGECPTVNLGGHGQTGGFGHLIHSYGLCIDYVHAFDIVLANGDFKRITRPKANAVLSPE